MSFLSVPMQGWLEIAVLLALLTVLVRPVGLYVAHVLSGRDVFLTPFVRPVERVVYGLCRIDPTEEMTGKTYFANIVALSVVGFVFLFLYLYLQAFPKISADLAFNMTASYLTNTNWQSYAPESTVTSMRQMAGLTVENFLSAAVGICVMAALARAMGRSKAEGVGNFWADLTRSLFYILLPASFVLALFLIYEGSIQTFADSVSFTTIEGGNAQTMPLGPVASQVAIKQVGSNGGGYFSANGAHPFENPTGLTNWIQILVILLFPASLTIAYDKMTSRRPHGMALYWAMMLIFVPMMLVCVAVEHGGASMLTSLGVDPSLGNMEGKEIRFGTTTSALWAAATTATSSGSVNSVLDSFTPLAALVPMAMMQMGEVVFGGLGSGLYGILVYVLLTAFLAGLMVGRSPEYGGKKIGVYEMKLVSIVVILHAFLTLTGTALALFSDPVMRDSLNPAYQGFTEVLYAFSSASFNNGSSLAHINANTPFMNIALGLCMLLGRFGVIAAVLLICNTMSQKIAAPSSAGTFRTDSPMFTGMLVGVIVVISILTFVPAWALGPMAEHFHLLSVMGGRG